MRKTSLVVLLALSACARLLPRETPPAHAGEYQRAIIDHSAPLDQVAKGPIADVPRVLDVLYRVRPDRRFVNAVADINELSTGRRTGEIDIEFAGHGWDVRLGSEKAVRFPELPAFKDALAILTNLARQQHLDSAPSTPSVFAAADADIARFRPRFLFHAVQQLDAAAKGKPLDGDGYARAARAAALLVSQTYADDFDLADPLRGRALAMLAIAESRDPACCRDTEALVASELGYESEANALASSLGRGYTRSLITDEPINSPGGAAEDALVLARRLKTEVLSPSKGEQKEFRETLDIEAGPYLLANGSSGNTWAFGQIIQSMILRSMDRNAPESVSFANPFSWRAHAAADPADLLVRYESRLLDFAVARAGRSLDSRSVMSFYDANWYAALHQPFAHLVFQQGAPDGSTSFVNSLHPTTATGEQVVNWMSRYVAADFARGGYFEKGGPASLDLIGGTAKYELFKSIHAAAGANSPNVYSAARDLFPSFDSRPAETFDAGQLADYPIGHIERRDLYLKSAFDRAPKRLSAQRVDFLSRLGDKDGLRAVAADRQATPWDRMQALDYLSQLSDENLDAAYERVFVDLDYHGACLPCFLRYANRRDEIRLKERIARKFLAKNPGMGAIEDAYVHSVIANALEAQGRYDEAWALVEQRVEVFSGNILLTAVSLLQRLGRDEESIKLGEQMIDRYPTADTYGNFATVLWRMHRYDQAAALFNPAKHRSSSDVLVQEVPADFLKSFSDVQMPDAIAAFDALIKENAPMRFLSAVVGAALTAHRPALSLALNDRLQTIPARGYDASTQVITLDDGYDAVLAMKGAESAIRWYLGHMPATKSGNEQVLMSLIDARKFDLASAVAAANPPGPNPIGVASLVATALALGRVPLSDARWNLVRSLTPAKAPPDGKTMFASIRYLMREGTEREVFASVTTTTDRSEAPFFVAARALSDRDYDNALANFLAAASGQTGYPTTSMSITRLWTWRAAKHSWSEIKSQGII